MADIVVEVFEKGSEATERGVNGDASMLVDNGVIADASENAAVNGHVQEILPFDYFTRVPDEIVRRIFNTLELRDRVRNSKVCRRFYRLLTDGVSALEDLVVINLFEMHIWDYSLNQSNIQRIPFRINDIHDLQNVFQHVNKVATVKIWYESTLFAHDCIDVLRDMNIRMPCIDLYPYTRDQVLDYVHSQLPNIEGITMRPHGANLWRGVDLAPIPNFANLQTLIMDSFNIDESIALPPRITTFEFMNRSSNSTDQFARPQWAVLMEKLNQMPNLEYFSLSHAEIGTISEFAEFMKALSPERVPKLIYLALKFCKFPQFTESRDESGGPRLEQFIPNLPKLKLQWLKMELCYCRTHQIARIFCEISKKLSMVVVNVIAEIVALQDLNTLSLLLDAQKIWAHISFLFKDQRKYPLKDSPYHQIAPSPALLRITSRIEASFVDDPVFIDNYIMGGQWHMCRDIRLIQCLSASNAMMAHFAMHSPHLRKVCLINCRQIDEDGVVNYVAHMGERTSKHLKIVWKRSTRDSRPGNLSLLLSYMYTEQMVNKKKRFYTKDFPEGDGEEVMIWETDSDRTLSIKDFDEMEEQRFLSIAVRSDFALHRQIEHVEAAAAAALANLPPAYQPPPPPE